MFDEDWVVGNAECMSQFHNETEGGYCRPVWDRYLCWPPTPPGQTATLRCPQSKGIDTSQYATRTCRLDGVWQGKLSDENITSNNSMNYGWTNYTLCFPPGIRDLLAVLTSQSDIERKLMAAEGTRILEMVGLSISMITLVISLIIFCKFRNLWNNRTRIHSNLFIAMFIQVLVRLIVYSDQYISRSNSQIIRAQPGTSTSTTTTIERHGIEDTEYLCESFYILLEYARTSMFLWMFVEGLYLHNMITVAVFQERLNAIFFYCIGWGCPLVLTVIWAVVTFDKFKGITCWWGYNLTPYFWILEGPRLTVIVLNLIFLLNIIRVLVTKMRESNSSEAQQVRKAVRAAIVLLPLLGITNSLQMLHSPVDKHPIQFAIWSYFNAFLTSFQGSFCALIYCFLNGEVQVSLRRCIRARKEREINPFPTRGVSLKLLKSYSPAEGKVGPLPKNNAEQEPKIQQKLFRDPLYESWSEAELSSHNHVNVEHIEIPESYLIRHANRTKTPTFISPKVQNENQNNSGSY